MRGEHQQVALILPPSQSLAYLVDSEAHVFAGVDLHYVVQVRRKGRSSSVLLIIQAELAMLVLSPQIDPSFGIECQDMRLSSGQLCNRGSLTEHNLADSLGVLPSDAVSESAPTVHSPICRQQEAV